MNRRFFFKNAGLAVAATSVLPLTASYSGKSPNQLINIGMIGTGLHGRDRNLVHYLKYSGLCRVVAVCDVSLSNAAIAKEMVDKSYGNDDCKVYQDFRELLEDTSIDAVQISTPDHWHVPISIMAALKGKHICCEKPTLTISEGRLLCDVINKTGVVYQVSLEDRMLPQYHQMAEIALNGRLGKIKHAEISLPFGPLEIPAAELKTTSPPRDLDFDLWLGPVPEVPYIHARTFFHFRWHDAFSGGILTDWGAHYCDTAQLVFRSEYSGPTEVVPVGETLYYNDGVFNTAYKFDLLYKYMDGQTMRVKTGNASIRIEGDDGWVESIGWRKPLVASDEKILDLSEKRIVLPTADNEFIDFLECIKSGRKTIYPPEIDHRNCSLLHCGNIALKLNRKLEWDPLNERFINDPEAEKFKKREMREKWSYSKICPEYKY